MAKGGFRHLVVVESGELCGIISMRDIMRVWRPSARPLRRRLSRAGSVWDMTSWPSSAAVSAAWARRRCWRAPGYRDVTVFERGERVGGVWHANTYPGAAWTSRRTCTSSRSRPTRAGRAATRRRPRSRPTWRRSRPLGVPTDPHRIEVPRGALRRGPLGARDERGPPRGRRADHRVRAALDAARAAAAGPRPLRRSRLPHRPLAPRRRAGRPPRSGDRDRLQRDPGRPAIQPVAAHVDVYQRSPGWTIPKLDFAYSARAQRLFARFPALQRPDRAADFAFHDFGARRDDPPPRLCGAFRALGRRRSGARSRTRSCGARSRRPTRSAASGSCSPTTGIRRSRRPNVELVDDRIAEITPTASAPRTAASAPPTCSCSPPASIRTRSSRRWRSPAPAAARSPRNGAPCRAPTSASPSPASRTCSCSTARTPTAAPAR